MIRSLVPTAAAEADEGDNSISFEGLELDLGKRHFLVSFRCSLRLGRGLTGVEETRRGVGEGGGGTGVEMMATGVSEFVMKI